METLPHYHGPFPRYTDRGRTDSAILIRPSICTVVSLVSLFPASNSPFTFSSYYWFLSKASTNISSSSGECASHFRAILNKFPPQVKTRSTAAAWACHVHNEVNKSLYKALFDCSNIGDFYDCGCAEEGEEGKKKEKETTDLKLEREG